MYVWCIFGVERNRRGHLYLGVYGVFYQAKIPTPMYITPLFLNIMENESFERAKALRKRLKSVILFLSQF
jgi:hypothetical protein